MSDKYQELYQQHKQRRASLQPKPQTEVENTDGQEDPGFLSGAAGATARLGLGAIDATISYPLQAFEHLNNFGINASENIARGLGLAGSEEEAAAISRLQQNSAQALVNKGMGEVGRGTDSVTDWVSEKAIPESHNQALQDTMPRGDLFSPETWEAGEDPSAVGYMHLFTEVLSSLAPEIAGAIAAGPAGAALLGGLSGAGSKGTEEEQRILETDFDTLSENSEYFNSLIERDVSPEDARQITARTAAGAASASGFVTDGIGGAAFAKIINPTFLRRIKGTASRVAARGAVGATTEGVQEVASTMAGRAASAEAIGEESRDLTSGTFTDFTLGVGMGAGAGSIGAFGLKPEQEQEGQQEWQQEGQEGPKAWQRPEQEEMQNRRNESSIDAMIAEAEKGGFNEEAVRLRSAQNILNKAHAVKDSDPETSDRLKQRGEAILNDLFGDKEQPQPQQLGLPQPEAKPYQSEPMEVDAEYAEDDGINTLKDDLPGIDNQPAWRMPDGNAEAREAAQQQARDKTEQAFTQQHGEAHAPYYGELEPRSNEPNEPGYEPNEPSYEPEPIEGEAINSPFGLQEEEATQEQVQQPKQIPQDIKLQLGYEGDALRTPDDVIYADMPPDLRQQVDAELQHRNQVVQEGIAAQQELKAIGQQAIEGQQVEPKKKQDVQAQRQALLEKINAANEVLAINKQKPIETVENTAKIKAIPGKKDTAYTPDNEPVAFSYALVEADDLNVSHDANGRENPEYPQELQQRERENAASQSQIHKIAAELNPELLADNKIAKDGAPIIGSDGVVESGNGRSAALRLAYEEGTPKSEEYRQYLKTRAQDFGLPVGNIDQMQKPVLVRVREGGIEDRKDFTRKANKPTEGVQNTFEKSRTDAEKIDDSLMRLWNPSETDGALSAGNIDFVRGFAQKLGQAESQGLLKNDGSPSREMANRIDAAIFHKAYENDRLTEFYADLDGPYKNLIKSLKDVAPKFAAAKTYNPELAGEVTNTIGQAFDIAEQARLKKQPIQEHLAQEDAFNQAEPEAARLASLFSINRSKPTRLNDILTTLATQTEGESKRSLGGDMFGDTFNGKDLINEAERQADQKEQPETSGDAMESARESEPAGDGRATADPTTERVEADTGGRSEILAESERAEPEPEIEQNQKPEPEQEPEQEPDFELAPQTQKELEQQDQKRQEREQAEAEAERQAKQREEAEKEAGDFVLTGSNSATDMAEARGQNNLFDQQEPGGQELEQELGSQELGQDTDSTQAKKPTKEDVANQATEAVTNLKGKQITDARKKLKPLFQKTNATMPNNKGDLAKSMPYLVENLDLDGLNALNETLGLEKLPQKQAPTNQEPAPTHQESEKQSLVDEITKVAKGMKPEQLKTIAQTHFASAGVRKKDTKTGIIKDIAEFVETDPVKSAEVFGLNKETQQQDADAQPDQGLEPKRHPLSGRAESRREALSALSIPQLERLLIEAKHKVPHSPPKQTQEERKDDLVSDIKLWSDFKNIRDAYDKVVQQDELIDSQPDAAPTQNAESNLRTMTEDGRANDGAEFTQQLTDAASTGSYIKNRAALVPQFKAAGLPVPKKKKDLLDALPELVEKGDQASIKQAMGMEPQEAVTEQQLIDTGLLNNRGDKWKYKNSLESGWMTANSKESAIERATEAYNKTPEDKRLTRDERYAQADQQEFQRMSERYGDKTIEQINQEIDRLDKKAGGTRSNKEFTDGGRRTGAAVSNEAARSFAEERDRLTRYRDEKFPEVQQEAAQPKTETSEALSTDLPEIIALPKKQYLAKKIKESGIKKQSPGYADAVERIESDYDQDLDRAYAGLPFEQYNELNKDTPEGINRQAHNSLKEEFGIQQVEPETGQTDATESTGKRQWKKEPGSKKVWRSDDGQIITDESMVVGGKKTAFFPVYASDKDRGQGNNYASGESFADAKKKTEARAAEQERKTHKDWELFDELPDGFSLLKDGSPLHGYSLARNHSPLRPGSKTILVRDPAAPIEQQNQSTKPRHKLGEPGAGIDSASLKQSLKSELGDLASLANVVQSADSLPQGVKDHAAANGIAMDQIKGVWHNGKAYIVADNLTDTGEAARTVLHEAVGHQGIHQVLGGEVNQVMDNIYRSFLGTPMLRDLKKTYPHLDANTAEGRRVLAEELVAHLAENNTKPNLFGKFVAAVRSAVRKLFPSLSFTENDVNTLIQKAREHVQNSSPDKASDSSAPEATRYSLRDRLGELRNRKQSTNPLNDKLRETDKGAMDRLKKGLQRWVMPGGLMPDTIQKLVRERDNSVKTHEFDVSMATGKLDEAIKRNGMRPHKFDDATWDKYHQYLTGKADGADLTQNEKDALNIMREHVDGMTREYVAIMTERLEQEAMEAGEITENGRNELERLQKMVGNIGQYLNRSYRAFDDPSWHKKLTDDVIDNARQYLVGQYTESGMDKAEAARKAEVALHEIVKTGTAYDNLGAFISEGKLGSKDLSMFIKRKQIAPEILALLGEYKDPRINYAKSIAKMSSLIANDRLLHGIREMATGSLIFEKDDRPPEATVQLAGEKSDVYSPLNGMWTTPEIKLAFEDAMGQFPEGGWLEKVIRVNGFIKYGKTVLSPTTAMRNLMSSYFFTLANGHFKQPWKTASAAFKAQVVGKTSEQQAEYIRKLTRLGVLYDGGNSGELVRMMTDGRVRQMLEGKSGAVFDNLRWINEKAIGFYRFGDDFWKIVGFENEKATLVNAGFSEADAEKEAAERIQNTYPTYSRVGKAGVWLSRFPLAGTFVSFPAEIIRTTVNMIRMTHKDWNSENPVLKKAAGRRMVGMSMAGGGMFALSALSKSMFGVSDDEEEALRDLAPPWQKNSTFIYTGRDKDGNLRYFDMTFLDPYGYFKRPLEAIMRDQPVDAALASSAKDLITPFLGVDIAAQQVFEVVANKKRSGGSVYKENDGPLDQAGDISLHLARGLAPGFVNNAWRTAFAAADVKRSTGQPYSLHDEMLALLGFRSSTFDPSIALYYRTFDFNQAASEARRELTAELRDPNRRSESDIKAAWSRAQRKQDKAFREMSRLVQAAKSSGLPRADIVRILSLSGISGTNIAYLLREETPPVKISDTSFRSAYNRAKLLMNDSAAQEVRKRFRQIKETNPQ